MMYYNNIRDMVGNTPMLELNNFDIKDGVSIFAKIEAMAGAIKLSKTIEKGNIVMIFSDRGDRYFSKNIYN